MRIELNGFLVVSHNETFYIIDLIDKSIVAIAENAADAVDLIYSLTLGVDTLSQAA